jgi:hypothetical protein
VAPSLPPPWQWQLLGPFPVPLPAAAGEEELSEEERKQLEAKMADMEHALEEELKALREQEVNIYVGGVRWWPAASRLAPSPQARLVARCTRWTNSPKP